MGSDPECNNELKMGEGLVFTLEVQKIFDIFGDKIRLVGGCVRDMLLERELHDYDFACVYEPDKIQEILAQYGVKSIPTGKEFGTITAVVNGKNFEITTLRDDVEGDGRHARVEFNGDFEMDAKRRDFSVNALYLDKDGEIYDYFSGMDDLKARKIRFIGDAGERIKEDYLRVLRFFRFSLGYAKSLDEVGIDAIEENREGLRKLSRERVRQEYFKILGAGDLDYLVEVLGVVRQRGVDQFLFTQKQDVDSLKNLFDLSKEFVFSASLNLRIACLFLGEGLDIDVFYKEICATRTEKKYFMFLLNNKIEKFDDVKVALVNYEKSMVVDFLAFSHIFALIKKEEFKSFLKFVEGTTVPNFPVSSQDILDLGFKGAKISKSLALLKVKWALSDYELSKENLLDIVN